MILTVAHRTTYSYDAPIRVAVQSLRLTPSVFDGQRVIDWTVDRCGDRDVRIVILPEFVQRHNNALPV